MKIKKNQKLSDYTTIGIGGPVPEVYLPFNEVELADLLKQFAGEKKAYRIIGNGSNILADDHGIHEVLVCTRGMERFFEVEDDVITVDAGYPMAQLAYQSASKGLSGLEFAVGIPGSIGGVVRMNAGAHQHTISEVTHSVRLVLPGGHLVTAYHEELAFSYRSSAIPNDAIITAVSVKLRPEGSASIHERIRKYNDQRTASQPLREKSAGCIFKNPGEASAGQLIEESGLKGFKIGGAVVSEKHANFIINRNNASFEDALKLIDHIKKVVRQKRGVSLEEEVIVWRTQD